ncbi:hypothetical protein GTQ34_13250 [Muricauda sp. JGD-17]|uniref:Prenyltransferase n=1 Tax=Flagellimonas ochracea TaxID=2696472 RepID=A0A964TF06_9FLAO|nr:hypothetical protein [Allomuricauda ochracea]NAY92883.1 hypothetical protein [Allomuricauda ochracea]
MGTLKFIFNFYLNASIHVSLAVVSLAAITFDLLAISWNFFLLGFVFFASVVCYNFVKYGVEAHKYLIVSNAYHRAIQVFSFLSFGFAIYFLWYLSPKIWVAVFVLGILSTLYAVPMLPNLKNLRSLGGFKIYIVALVWVGFTALLPILDANVLPTWDLGMLCLQRFILVLILILPFEIRDMHRDDKALKTLPQVIGPKKTQKLGLVLIGIFFLLTFFKDVVDGKEVLLRSVLVLFLVLIFLFDQRRQSNYFASFWVEGIPIFWLVLFRFVNEFF